MSGARTKRVALGALFVREDESKYVLQVNDPRGCGTNKFSAMNNDHYVVNVDTGVWTAALALQYTRPISLENNQIWDTTNLLTMEHHRHLDATSILLGPQHLI
jgi:hypothetical protein